MSEQAITFLRTLNSIVYSVSLSEALSILDAAGTFAAAENAPVITDWTRATLDQRVAHARTLPGVVENLPDSKIRAIKAVRDEMKIGLKESKEVVDTIQPPPSYNRLCCTSRSDERHSPFCYYYTD